jgi:hypothetical protein
MSIIEIMAGENMANGGNNGISISNGVASIMA